MSRLDIDLVTDVVCPWCFVGTHRLDRVLARLGVDRPDVEVVIHHHPFELMPGTPRTGTNVPEMLRRKYGAEPKKLWARVEAAARESELALDPSHQPLAFPTIPAHTMARMGRENGSEHAIVRSLYDAYFTRAQDIADPDALARIGEQHGLDPERVRRAVTDERELALTKEEARIWQHRGVSGVPFFVFAERLAFSGAQTEDVMREVIDKALALPSG